MNVYRLFYIPWLNHWWGYTILGGSLCLSAWLSASGYLVCNFWCMQIRVLYLVYTYPLGKAHCDDMTSKLVNLTLRIWMTGEGVGCITNTSCVKLGHRLASLVSTEIKLYNYLQVFLWLNVLHCTHFLVYLISKLTMSLKCFTHLYY